MLPPPLSDLPDTPLYPPHTQEVKTLCNLLLSWTRLTHLCVPSFPTRLLQAVETLCSGAGITEKGLMRGSLVYQTHHS